jgi:hypothetical protein
MSGGPHSSTDLEGLGAPLLCLKGLTLRQLLRARALLYEADAALRAGGLLCYQLCLKGLILRQLLRARALLYEADAALRAGGLLCY